MGDEPKSENSEYNLEYIRGVLSRLGIEERLSKMITAKIQAHDLSDDHRKPPPPRYPDPVHIFQIGVSIEVKRKMNGPHEITTTITPEYDYGYEV